MVTGCKVSYERKYIHICMYIKYLSICLSGFMSFGRYVEENNILWISRLLGNYAGLYDKVSSSDRPCENDVLIQHIEACECPHDHGQCKPMGYLHFIKFGTVYVPYKQCL
jgi:hypothetical protein